MHLLSPKSHLDFHPNPFHPFKNLLVKWNIRLHCIFSLNTFNIRIRIVLIYLFELRTLDGKTVLRFQKTYRKLLLNSKMNSKTRRQTNELILLYIYEWLKVKAVYCSVKKLNLEIKRVTIFSHMKSVNKLFGFT